MSLLNSRKPFNCLYFIGGRRGTKSSRRSNAIEENGVEDCDSDSSGDEDQEVKGQNEQPAEEKVNGTTEIKRWVWWALFRIKVTCPIPTGRPSTGWSVACSTVEEWSELIESFDGVKHQETKRLRRNLQGGLVVQWLHETEVDVPLSLSLFLELLPEVEYLVHQREKELKKKLLAELPRRTSDRIALKAQQKIEEERLDAIAREMQREELRRLQAEEEKEKQEELERKRQKKREEALERRKAKEEAQQKQREEEEENWEKALSGELSGRRKAAIGAENVSEEALIHRQFQLVEGRDEDLYTAMYKSELLIPGGGSCDIM